MIRIGMISFAHMHAYSYARSISRHPGAKITAIAESDPGRRSAAAEKLGVADAHDDVAVLLERDDVDAVVVCSENVRHAEHAIAAARAGKHVLCEKPLATRSEDAARMVESAADAGVVLMTAFPCRFHPAARRTHGAIAGGALGHVLAVNGTNHGKNPGGWFVDPRLSGGGAIADHTVHVVDLLRWMTTEEVREVHAEATNFDSSLDCEDGAILSLAFDSLLATLDCSWSRPRTNPVWGDVTLEVVGTDGVLSLDLFAQEHTVVRDGGGTPVSGENWGDDMDAALLREFVAAVADRRDPAVTGVDGLRALEVVEAAYRSVASGRPEAVQKRSV